MHYVSYIKASGSTPISIFVIISCHCINCIWICATVSLYLPAPWCVCSKMTHSVASGGVAAYCIAYLHAGMKVFQLQCGVNLFLVGGLFTGRFSL